MDEFSEKHKMVQKLLAMLKNHAANEVDSGLKKPEGEGDMHGVQVEKVEVLPDHEMDKATPDHEVETKLVDEGKHTANASYNQGGMAYNKGGVVEDVNAEKYSREGNTKIPYESDDGEPDTHGAVEKEAGESLDSREASDTEESVNPPGRKYAADEEPRSPFASFFGKKKRHSL